MQLLLRCGRHGIAIQLSLQIKAQGLEGLGAGEGLAQASRQCWCCQGGQLQLAQLQGIAYRWPLQAVNQASDPKQATEHQAQQGKSSGPSRALAGLRGGTGVQTQALQGAPMWGFWPAPLPYDGI